MPRKAKPGAVPIVVQDVATGRVLHTLGEPLRDDFTGEPIAEPEQPSAKPVPTADDLRAAAHARKVAGAKLFLQRTGAQARARGCRKSGPILRRL